MPTSARSTRGRSIPRAAAGCLVVAGFALIVGACSSPEPRSEPRFTHDTIAIPSAHYLSITWPIDDEIVVGRLREPEEGPGVELLALDPVSGDRRVLTLTNPHCGRIDAFALTTLPTNDIGLLESCLKNPDWGFPPANRLFLSAAHLDGGPTTRIMRQTLGFNARQFTWNPSMTEGFASTLSDLCGSITGLTPEGPEPVPIRVNVGGAVWELDDYFQELPDASCKRYGRADWPALSPDGKFLAFMVSAPQAGVTGFDVATAPWDLMLMGDGAEPEIVVREILHPRGLAWSPDGRSVSFSGQIMGRGRGVWVYRPSSAALFRVWDGSVHSLAWSPDGDRIVGVYAPDISEPFAKQILLFDVAVE